MREGCYTNLSREVYMANTCHYREAVLHALIGEDSYHVTTDHTNTSCPEWDRLSFLFEWRGYTGCSDPGPAIQIASGTRGEAGPALAVRFNQSSSCNAKIGA